MKIQNSEQGGKATMGVIKNPNRVAAGQRNRQKWTGFTPAGLERLRSTARVNQPWRTSTGPKSSVGKARSAANGKGRQKGLWSVRQLRTEIAACRQLERLLQATTA